MPGWKLVDYRGDGFYFFIVLFILKKRSCLLLVAGIVSFGLCRARGTPIVFSIDRANSQLTLSGSAGGATFVKQGGTSLVTSYTGSFNANVTDSTIQFTGGSTIDAKTNGVWKPAIGGGTGSAPADYGVQASIPFAILYGAPRNILLDLTSPVLTMNNGNFSSSLCILSFPTNSNPTADYNAGFFGSGTIPPGGLSTNSIVSGTFVTTIAGVQKVTIQIDSQFSFSTGFGNVALRLKGQIVATNSLPPVFKSMVVSNQNFVLSVENATLQSLLQSSTNLKTWSTAGGTVTSNSGRIIFTTPMAGTNKFFRVQK